MRRYFKVKVYIAVINAHQEGNHVKRLAFIRVEGPVYKLYLPCPKANQMSQLCLNPVIIKKSHALCRR